MVVLLGWLTLLVVVLGVFKKDIQKYIDKEMADKEDSDHDTGR